MATFEKLSVNTLAYRPDIDGLRAIAVLSVVLYHAFPNSISGGFVGVDVFFVISGFLISTNIFLALENNKFSFANFFARRIRRLFPSLIIVTLCSLICGWFLLVPDEYALLGKHIASSAVFITNFVLAAENGYFDVAAETKPLLHLWSLAVEEQFYLIWPFAAWFAWKFNFNLLKITLIVGFFSLVGSLLLTHAYPDDNFFWPIGRFWEILTGSALAWILLHKEEWVSNIPSFSNGAVLLGLIGLSATVILMNNTLIYPSFWAILPVISTSLIIIGGSTGIVSRVLLQNSCARWIGLISYPLYLWHWPLLSYFQVINGSRTSVENRFLIVFISIALAFGTYFFIERFFNARKITFNLSAILVSSFTIVGLLGYHVYSMYGFKDRFVAINSSIISRTTEIGSMTELIDECGLEGDVKSQIAHCFSDARSPVRYAMIGDSKAAALISGVVRTSSDSGRWLMIGGNNPNGNASPFLSDHSQFERSKYFLPFALDAVGNNSDVEVVVLVGAMRVFAGIKQSETMPNLLNVPASNIRNGWQATRNTVLHLLENHKKIVLVVDNPPLGDHASCGARAIRLPFYGVVSKNLSGSPNCFLELNEFLRLRKPYLDALQSISDEFPNEVYIFDPVEIFCDKPENMCLRFKDRESSFSYTDHISDYMAGLIGKELNQYLDTLSVSADHNPN
ncbi:acyltransferase [Planktomarina temperata]|nr:acyltransferase [Planktomarina temperata]